MLWLREYCDIRFRGVRVVFVEDVVGGFLYIYFLNLLFVEFFFFFKK